MGAVAAAITGLAVVIALAVFVPPPPPPLEPVVLDMVDQRVDADANLIAHTWGTELVLVASGLEDGSTYILTFVGSDGTTVPGGTFVGIGDEPLTCNLTAALLRNDAAGFTVTTPDGTLVLEADLT